MNYPRTEYEMTEDDMKAILEASKPTAVMFLGGGTPMGGNQQENANRAWKALGGKMGFDYMTVRPGRTSRQFTAVPSETVEQKAERVKREAEERSARVIAALEKEIADRQAKLAILKGQP